MKKWSEQWKQKFKDYWKKLYDSSVNKLTKGSQQISKMVNSAHKDNWRRPRK